MKNNNSIIIGEFAAIIAGIIVGILTFYTLFFLNSFIMLSERILYSFFAGMATIFLKKNLTRLRTYFSTHYKKVEFFILNSLLCFSLTGGFYLFDKTEYNWTHPAFVFFVLCYFWCIPISLALIYFINYVFENCKNFKIIKRFSSKQLIGLFFISFMFGMLYLIAYNPCITTGDSKGMWDVIHKIPNVKLIDWIPPLYLCLNAFLVRIFDSLTAICLFQVLLWSAVVIRSTSFLSAYLPKEFALLFYILTAMNYANIIQVTTFWKDALFVPGLLWFTVCLAELMTDEFFCTKSPMWYASFLISTFLTAFMRQSGLYVVCATLLLLLLMNRNVRIIIASVVIFLLVITVRVQVYKALDVEPQPQMKYMAMGNDIMYVYFHGGNLSDEGMEIVNQITGGSPEKYQFDAYSANYNRDALWEYSVYDFAKAYVKTFTRNPQLVTRAVMTRTSIGWSVDKTIGQIDMLTCYTGERLDETGEFDYHYQARKRNVLTSILDCIHGVLYNIPILYVLFWRTGLYLIIIFFSSSVASTSWNARKKVFLPALPVVFNFVTLIISSAWPDYRYYWPCNVIGIFLFFYNSLVVSRMSNKQYIC